MPKATSAINQKKSLQKPKKLLYTSIFGALISTILSGCSLLNTNSTPRQIYSNVDIHGTYSTVQRDDFEKINIIELVDPSGEAKIAYKSSWDTANLGGRYDLVFNWFRLSTSQSAESKRLTRNSIQERMLGASTSRCNVYKTYLQRAQSDTNFSLGLGTTIAGALGAIIPGQTASRNLAGTAGILSGAQAEFNQAYFSNLAANTIIKGIESRLAAVQSQIRTQGQPRTISDYPLEAAIRDAVYYDGLCSTVVGLQEAENSIRLVNNPGLAEAARAIASAKLITSIANNNAASLSADGELGRLQALIAQSASPLAALQSTSGSEVSPPDILGSLELFKARIDSEISQSADSVVNDFSAKSTELTKTKANKEDQAKIIRDRYLETLKSGLQEVWKEDVAACDARIKLLTGELATAAASRKLAITPVEQATAKKDYSSAQLKAQDLIQRFQTTSNIVTLDLDTAKTSAIATWKDVKDSNELTGIVKSKIIQGWPSIIFATKLDRALCN